MNQLAIVCDMDGVLIDSEPWHVETELITCREFNIIVPDVAWQQFKGKPDLALFSFVVENYLDAQSNNQRETPITAQLLANRKEQIYLAGLTEQIKLIAGAADFLAQMQAAQYPMALTTSTKRHITERILKQFNFTHYFPVTITGDEVRCGKPDPEPYLNTAAALSIAPQHCLVIEDSLNGVRSSQSAGCITVGLTTSFTLPELQAAGAEFVYDSFAELMQHWPTLQQLLIERLAAN